MLNVVNEAYPTQSTSKALNTPKSRAKKSCTSWLLRNSQLASIEDLALLLAGLAESFKITDTLCLSEVMAQW